MISLLFWGVLFGDPIPIKVDPGHPVPKIEVKSLLNGQETNLREVFNDGFAIFMTPTCHQCQKGMPNVQRWKKDYDLIFVYVGDEKEIRKFIKDHDADLGNSFYVEADELVPWGLVTLPAVLTFNEGRCKVAMHGPLHDKNLQLLESFYMGTARINKRIVADSSRR